MLLSHKGKYLKQLHFKIKNNLKQSVTKANSLSTFLSENWLLSLPLCRLIPGQFSALLIHPNAVSTICIGTICWGFYTCQFLHAEDLSPQCQSRYFCQEILREGYLHWNVLTFSELNILFWLIFFLVITFTDTCKDFCETCESWSPSGRNILPRFFRQVNRCFAIPCSIFA